MFTPNGLIGKSGKFYPCNRNEHDPMQWENEDDMPFVAIRTHHHGRPWVSFDAYYTITKETPNQAQFETLMDWCTATGNTFEDVTDCWDLPWAKWRG